MRTLLKIVGVLVLGLVLAVAGAYVWVSTATSRIMSRTMAAHAVDFPVPFPVDVSEPGFEMLAESQRAELALARARDRGQHLVQARYGCVECHGANFGGGTMVDAFPIGSLLGPNLTSGEGSKTIGYTMADWDRIVRHGIRRDGKPAIMPSGDFRRMSDQELSDIIVYIQSAPAVANAVPERSFGPLGKFLVATGGIPIEADLIPPDAPHAAFPPPTEATIEFGQHLAGVCTGCHRADLGGGAIPGGDPSWEPARNLTPHPDALGRWTYDQFIGAMRNGVRPDGTALKPPMTLMRPYAQRMQDVELQALWRYLQSMPPIAGSGLDR